MSSHNRRPPPRIDLSELRNATTRLPRGDLAPEASDVAETREEQIYRLKLEGNSPKDIAFLVKVPVADVEETIIRMAEASRTRLLAELSVGAIMEVDRLEAMHRALWPNAKAGEPSAIDRVLQVSKERRKLLGLDAPTGIGQPAEMDLSVLTDRELADYERIQKKLLGAKPKPKRLPKPSPPPAEPVIDVEPEGT